MSRGDLQEMEVGTKQSKTAVNANAKAGDAMPSLSGATPGQTGGWEDLGGPDPSNYRPDDDSAKLKTPGGTLKQVKDVVNKGAAAAEAMKGVKEDEEFEYDEDEELLEDTEEVVAEAKHEEEEEEEGGKKKGKKEEEEEEEEEEEMEEEFNIDEDVNALLAGEELSEEFQEKARTIFEAALRSKVSDIKEALEEQYTAALAEEVEEIKTELSERLDAYLEYVAGEWMEENALVIEHGLKTEMTESFLQGMKGLFEEHYVSIPEDKYDVLESMVEKLDEMETKLNEQIEKNVSLNKRLAESVADGIFEQVAVGLADTQRDKLASLAESVEFESEEEYREKLETLKESYFPSRGVSPSTKSDTLSEGVSSAYESHSPAMAAYLKSLSAFSK
jgi:outer membrane protein OmpA-like peptidoglycan-associated protein